MPNYTNYNQASSRHLTVRCVTLASHYAWIVLTYARCDFGTPPVDTSGGHIWAHLFTYGGTLGQPLQPVRKRHVKLLTAQGTILVKPRYVLSCITVSTSLSTPVLPTHCPTAPPDCSIVSHCFHCFSASINGSRHIPPPHIPPQTAGRRHAPGAQRPRDPFKRTRGLVTGRRPPPAALGRGARNTGCSCSDLRLIRCTINATCSNTTFFPLLLRPLPLTPTPALAPPSAALCSSLPPLSRR